MGFARGDKNINRSGRPRGRPNKSTEEIRRMIQLFIEKNFERLQEDFDGLDTPKERLYFLEKMLAHTLPRPLHELERLTDSQLDEIIKKLKKGTL